MKKLMIGALLTMSIGLATAAEAPVRPQDGRSSCSVAEPWDGKVTTLVKLSAQIVEGAKVVNDLTVRAMDGKSTAYSDFAPGLREGVSVVVTPKLVDGEKVDVVVCLTKTDLVFNGRPGTVAAVSPGVSEYRLVQYLALEQGKVTEIPFDKYVLRMAAAVDHASPKP